MDYEQFVEKFLDDIKQNMEHENVELHRLEVQKVNEKLDGVSIRYPDSPVAPTIYLESKYQMYQDGYTVEEVAESTTKQLEQIRRDTPAMPNLSPESAKNNLYCAVVNAEDNKELLKNIPHEKVEDLAVIARFKVGEDGSFIVSNDMCKHLKMTSEEIMEQAHSNTSKQQYECRNMNEVMKEIMVAQGMPEEYVDEMIQSQGEGCPLYVLTNQSRVDGAVAMADKKALEKACEQIGEDFYILPSSRHEVLLVPSSVVTDVKDLKDMVEQVNSTEVSKADKLSDHVYKYDSLSKKLSMADAPVMSEGKSMANELLKSHAKSH